MSTARYSDWHSSPSIAAKMMGGIFAAIDAGLTDSDMPLTDDQRAFLATALLEMSS